MKSTTIKYTSIPSITLALFLCACSDPTEDNPVNSTDEIIGTWHHESNWGDNFILRYEINYLISGNYEKYAKLYDRSSKDFSGYLGRSEGTFKVENSILMEISNAEFVAPEGLPHRDLGALLLSTATGYERSSSIKMNNESTVLKILPICGPLDQCVANQSYISYIKSGQ